MLQGLATSLMRWMIRLGLGGIGGRSQSLDELDRIGSEALALPSESDADSTLDQGSPFLGAWGDARKPGRPVFVVERLPDGRFAIACHRDEFWTGEARGPKLLASDRGPVIEFVLVMRPTDGSEHPFAKLPMKVYLAMDQQNRDRATCTMSSPLSGPETMTLERLG
jgi:hypothetical protein